MAKYYSVKKDYMNAFDINNLEELAYWDERYKIEGAAMLHLPEFKAFEKNFLKQTGNGVDVPYFKDILNKHFYSSRTSEDKVHNAYKKDYSYYMHFAHMKRIAERQKNGGVTSAEKQAIEQSLQEIKKAQEKLNIAQQAVDNFIETSGLSKKPRELKRFRDEYERRKTEVEEEKERRRLFKAKVAVQELEVADYKRRFAEKLEKLARENVAYIREQAREAFAKGNSYIINGVELHNENQLKNYLNKLKAERELAVETATNLNLQEIPNLNKEVFGDYLGLQEWYELQAYKKYQEIASPITYDKITGFTPEIEQLIELEAEKDAAEDVVNTLEENHQKIIEKAKLTQEEDNNYNKDYLNVSVSDTFASGAAVIGGGAITVGATIAAITLTGGALLPVAAVFAGTFVASAVGSLIGINILNNRKIEKLRKKWWPKWFPPRTKENETEQKAPEEDLTLDPKKVRCPEPPHRKAKKKQKSKTNGNGKDGNKYEVVPYGSKEIAEIPYKEIEVFGKIVRVPDEDAQKELDTNMQDPSLNAVMLKTTGKVVLGLNQQLSKMREAGIPETDPCYEEVNNVLHSQIKQLIALQQAVREDLTSKEVVYLTPSEKDNKKIHMLEKLYDRFENMSRTTINDIGTMNEYEMSIKRIYSYINSLTTTIVVDTQEQLMIEAGNLKTTEPQTLTVEEAVTPEQVAEAGERIYNKMENVAFDKSEEDEVIKAITRAKASQVEKDK